MNNTHAIKRTDINNNLFAEIFSHWVLSNPSAPHPPPGALSTNLDATNSCGVSKWCSRRERDKKIGGSSAKRKGLKKCRRLTRRLQPLEYEWSDRKGHGKRVESRSWGANHRFKWLPVNSVTLSIFETVLSNRTPRIPHLCSRVFCVSQTGSTDDIYDYNISRPIAK